METFFIGLFAILLGGLLTFAGYQFFRVLIPIFGFFAGFIWGADVITGWFGMGFLSTVTSWIIGFGLGMLLAVLAYMFYQVAVGVLAGMVGYWLAMVPFQAIGLDGFLATVIALVAGVALGIWAIYANAPKWLLVALTAFAGATASIGGLLVMFGIINPVFLGTSLINAIIAQSFFWSLSWIGLVGVGFYTQTVLSRNISEVSTQDYYGYSIGSDVSRPKKTTTTTEKTKEEIEEETPEI